VIARVEAGHRRMTVDTLPRLAMALDLELAVIPKDEQAAE
jgi:hypothetical protein